MERVKKSRGEGTNREPVQRVLPSSCASRKMRSPRLAHKATVMQATRHLGDAYPTFFPGFSPTCPSLRRGDEFDGYLF